MLCMWSFAGQRDLVMKRFRNHTLQMLVATDVAARGIDVDGTLT